MSFGTPNGETGRLRLEAQLGDIERRLTAGGIKRRGLRWVGIPGLLSIHGVLLARLLDFGITPSRGLALVALAVVGVGLTVFEIRKLEAEAADLRTARDDLLEVLDRGLTPAPTPQLPECAT